LGDWSSDVCSSDLIMFSISAQEHAQMLENVFQRFIKADLQLLPEKCVFAQSQVQYLDSSSLKKGSQPQLIR
jgi:hypothetical protein